MKKQFIFIFVLMMLFQSFAVAKAADNKGVITSKAMVEKEMEPEAVVLVLAVENTHKDATVAADDNKEISKKVVNAIKPKLNKVTKDFIKTSNYSVSPVYSYKDKKKKLLYYRAKHEFTIQTSKIDSAGEFLDLGVKNGINKVRNIYFILLDTKPTCKALLKQASKKAKAEAKDITTTLGSDIVGIKNIDYSCSTHNSYVKSYRYKAALNRAWGSSEAVSNPTPIQSSKIKIYANVDIDFYVGGIK